MNVPVKNLAMDACYDIAGWHAVPSQTGAGPNKALACRDTLAP
jgi:hypothetical protein